MQIVILRKDGVTIQANTLTDEPVTSDFLKALTEAACRGLGNVIQVTDHNL